MTVSDRQKTYSSMLTCGSMSLLGHHHPRCFECARISYSDLPVLGDKILLRSYQVPVGTRKGEIYSGTITYSAVKGGFNAVWRHLVEPPNLGPLMRLIKAPPAERVNHHFQSDGLRLLAFAFISDSIVSVFPHLGKRRISRQSRARSLIGRDIHSIAFVGSHCVYTLYEIPHEPQ